LKTINSIKYIIYNTHELTDFVKRFITLTNTNIISYENSTELETIIQKLKPEISSKEVIIFTKFKGRLFQVCPGSPKMICCNLRLVNTGFNCLYNCTYCYLQSYLNSYGIQLFSNMDDVYKELLLFLEGSDKKTIYRIGSGEFTDSLMIDEITGVGKRFIEITANHHNIMFELKTKSNQINHLLHIKNKGNTVLGWSVNTPFNIKHYESGSSDLTERLQAAQLAAESGYFISFHFDPIIIHDNYFDEYSKVIHEIFSYIPKGKIAWISLGTVRYPEQFLAVMKNNFVNEKISDEEFLPGMDGKLRYQWSVRAKIYNHIKKTIHAISPETYIYMCMEDLRMWEYVFGLSFESSEELEIHFSNSMKNFIKKI
jgi:spore photoproduct lyase